MPQNKLIVKVQLSLAPEGQVLVYNEDRKITYQDEIDDEQFFKELRKKMRKESKQFFYAHIEKNGMLSLDRLAPWQDW